MSDASTTRYLTNDDPSTVTYRGREGEPYRPDLRLVSAANTAIALGMPLLLTGEPGSGKTDFAFVLARWNAEQQGFTGDWKSTDPEHGLLDCYVRSDTRARDLLYTYDALARFGDAYHGGDGGKQRASDARHYIELAGLGRALQSERRRVVLIDEIDKAPRDLPNDLLRELDQREFEIPEIPADAPEPAVRALRRRMGRRDAPEAQRPLVVITSNAERQLPDAFLRRCVFYHLPLPEPEQLRTILLDRFGPRDGGLVGPAVHAFTLLRENASLIKRPATSELIAWVHALLTVATDSERSWLEAQDLGNKQLKWSEVPRLECLIKLREDMVTLRVTTKAAAARS